MSPLISKTSPGHSASLLPKQCLVTFPPGPRHLPREEVRPVGAQLRVLAWGQPVLQVPPLPCLWTLGRFEETCFSRPFLLLQDQWAPSVCLLISVLVPVY